MVNQCCCKEYNKVDNCVGCDLDTYTDITANVTVSGFSNNWDCDVASHVNRTLAHVVYTSAGPEYPGPTKCCDTLIAGNATPPYSHCEYWCPPYGYAVGGGLSWGDNCPVDIDIGANGVPGRVSINITGTGCVTSTSCTCIDWCEYVKKNPYNFGFAGPTCYLTIWYTLCFEPNAAEPDKSIVSYAVGHSYAGRFLKAYDYTTSSWCDVQDTTPWCCTNGTPSGLSVPRFVLYAGSSYYDSSQLCSSFGTVDVPLCPWGSRTNPDEETDCDWGDLSNDPRYDDGCKTDFVVCGGAPMEHNGAKASVSLSLS